jgi:hypothetical protein
VFNEDYIAKDRVADVKVVPADDWLWSVSVMWYTQLTPCQRRERRGGRRRCVNRRKKRCRRRRRHMEDKKGK